MQRRIARRADRSLRQGMRPQDQATNAPSLTIVGRVRMPIWEVPNASMMTRRRVRRRQRPKRKPSRVPKPRLRPWPKERQLQNPQLKSNVAGVEEDADADAGRSMPIMPRRTILAENFGVRFEIIFVRLTQINKTSSRLQAYFSMSDESGNRLYCILNLVSMHRI